MKKCHTCKWLGHYTELSSYNGLLGRVETCPKCYSTNLINMKTLAQLELQALDLAEEINKLKEAEKHVPWEPQDVPYLLTCEGAVVKNPMIGGYRNGRSFASPEAAQKASKFFTFYQRLYQLALECNAKHGPVSTRFRPVQDSWGKWAYYSYETTSSRSTELLFTSTGSIKEACNIMNRDQWIMPTI